MNYDTERNTENDCTELVAEQCILPCLCGQSGPVIGLYQPADDLFYTRTWIGRR